MSDAELLIVLGGAVALIAATFFSKLRRKRRHQSDYCYLMEVELGGKGE